MKLNNLEFQFQPIGFAKCSSKYKFEAPRQSSLADNSGVIKLVPGINYKQVLDGLELFDRIWLIYSFHHNKNWKNMVMPPRGSRKVGVFATRSPYRPNPIGMSCVKLDMIKDNKLYISDFDLLDETPILDIKPYISYCDSFPNAKTGWIPTENLQYNITNSELFKNQAIFVFNKTGYDIEQFCRVQLLENPTDCTRKRIKPNNDNDWILAYRTWRINYSVQNCHIMLNSITTGYSSDDLANSHDQYQDKCVHKEYLTIWKP
ncbi:MAG: tRNA (N6-threonylcarbamoyladenosine(37)-N6)-methyltransferase TrmO [Lentisphaeria bacterium]